MKKTFQYKCRCIDPPPNTPFVKGEIYELLYCIDGYGAATKDGFRWYTGEYKFYWYFQMLPDKKEEDMTF